MDHEGADAVGCGGRRELCRGRVREPLGARQGVEEVRSRDKDPICEPEEGVCRFALFAPDIAAVERDPHLFPERLPERDIYELRDMRAVMVVQHIIGRDCIEELRQVFEPVEDLEPPQAAELHGLPRRREPGDRAERDVLRVEDIGNPRRDPGATSADLHNVREVHSVMHLRRLS